MRVVKNPLGKKLVFGSAVGYSVVIPSKGKVIVSDEQAKVLLRVWKFLEDGGEYKKPEPKKEKKKKKVKKVKKEVKKKAKDEVKIVAAAISKKKKKKKSK